MLLDLVVRFIEERRRGPDHLVRAVHPGAGRGVALQRGAFQGAAGQGGRRRKTGGHEPEVVPCPGSLGLGHRCGTVGTVIFGVVVRAAGGVLVVDGVGVDVVQRRAGVQHGRRPGGVRPGLLRIEDPDLRGDIAEQVQQQEVPRPAPGLQGRVLIGGEQHGQVPAAGQEGLEVGGQQGSCRVARCADGPVLLRPEQQPFAVRAEVHVHRDVELHPLPVAQHRGGLLEEADPVHGEGPLEPRGGVVRHEGHHVVLGDFEQPLRRGQGFAAAQLDAGPGVGGRGAGQAFGRGGDQQGVGVEPGGVALRRRQVKAAGRRVDEAAGLDVELAVAVGVAAVGGEGQQRQPVRFALGRAQEAGAVEDPFLAFRRGQRVHVQEDIPLRRPAPVALPGGAAPQALRVVPVLPEVVVPLAVLAHHGDPVGGVQHLEDAGFQCGVLRVFQQFLGAGVLFPDPGQLFLAVDLLEPDVLVDGFGGGHLSGGPGVGVGGGRGSSVSGGHFSIQATSARQ